MPEAINPWQTPTRNTSPSILYITQPQARLIQAWDWLKEITGLDDNFDVVALPPYNPAMRRVRELITEHITNPKLRVEFNSAAHSRNPILAPENKQ